jgi:amidase
MTAWIVRFDVATPEGRPRVAVKDAIDMAGVPTTAGCVAVRERAAPAAADAECLAGIRAAGVPVVGKTTLTELCLSPTGINDAFGTPVNPLAPDRVPGGSSSGSAVALALGEADIALGTDTGGSVRIPAACCGIAGLKTTHGRVPTTGVWPLAPTLDTVGPLARDVAGVSAGMALLEPGFAAAAQPARVVGRLRISGIDPATEAAVDAALAASGLTVRPVVLSGTDQTFDAYDTIVLGEFWQHHHGLLGVEGVGSRVQKTLRNGRVVAAERLDAAYAERRAWQDKVARVLDGVDVLALPTLVGQPPRLGHRGFLITRLTAPFNLAGVPALSMPVPSPGTPVPASLQLVGPSGGEELLCATGMAVEAALR